MLKRIVKIFFVCLLVVILSTGCNAKPKENLNNDGNSDVTDNNQDNVVNDNNKISTIGLSGYLVTDEEYKNRYYGFDNVLGDKITKEFNINDEVYKFDVEMISLSKGIEYKIYLNNQLLDTITYEPKHDEHKNIDLFVLDGYAIIGYVNGDANNHIKVYNLSNYKLVDSFKITSEITTIVNEFVLTNSYLSFVDVSSCPFKKVIIEVKNNNVKISRQYINRDELDKYELSGGVC